MNRDQAKGHLKDTVGKAQEKLGRLTGSAKQRVKGMAKQVAGKAQKGVGDAKQLERKGHV